MWIRHVLVPKWTDDDYYLQKLRDFIDTLNGVERVEVLPYHDMAKFKYKELGYEYELNDINPPTKDRVKKCDKKFYVQETILIKKEGDFLSSSFFIYKKIPLQFGMVFLISY